MQIRPLRIDHNDHRKILHLQPADCLSSKVIV